MNKCSDCKYFLPMEPDGDGEYIGTCSYLIRASQPEWKAVSVPFHLTVECENCPTFVKANQSRLEEYYQKVEHKIELLEQELQVWYYMRNKMEESK